MPTLTIYHDRHFDLLTNEQEKELHARIKAAKGDPAVPSAHLGYDMVGDQPRTVPVNGEPRQVSLVEHTNNTTVVEIPEDDKGWHIAGGKANLLTAMSGLFEALHERHFPPDAVTAIHCDDDRVAALAAVITGAPKLNKVRAAHTKGEA